MTTDKGLVERLESHMGQQDVPVLIHDCRQAAARIRELEAKVEKLNDAGMKMLCEISKQARDLGRLEAFRDAAEARCRKLEEALRESSCPRPCNGRPDDFTLGQCVDAGECGCYGARALLGQADGEGR